jgi:hypothetical protein
MSDEIFNLDRFLPNWARVFGSKALDNKGIPYVKMPPSKYAEAFDSLIKTLIKKGYTREMLERATFVSKLYEVMTAKYAKKRTLDIQKSRIERAWNECIRDTFFDAADVEAGEKPEIKHAEEVVIIDRPLVQPGMGDPTPTESVIDESIDIFAGVGEENG